MIKIKLLEPHIHRNETTFRPFLFAQHVLKEVGIEFTDGDSYDYEWVGQASIVDKLDTLENSIDKGVEFVSKITGDYMIVDGQDATSLIGTIDVFRESNAKLFLKNSILFLSLFKSFPKFIKFSSISQVITFLNKSLKILVV